MTLLFSIPDLYRHPLLRRTVRGMTETLATAPCRGYAQEFRITTATLAAFRAADDISATTYTDEQAIESIDFCESCAGVA